jgi:hypothetical protein
VEETTLGVIDEDQSRLQLFISSLHRQVFVASKPSIHF